ncbi:hypothetical protein K458DRAFT_413080 [Lentithecium fluviatile CBS 122367]|uniref:Uncharacterized protein n=1 Tax=Lentithecium fluviatile CBS 122367 TaxID=1168545 RepID=A0A6G1JIH7_9PLEO|nr:hypothetical protein K458DRAFT_413080 [Lentithecium fluviatile CBS 122367]
MPRTTPRITYAANPQPPPPHHSKQVRYAPALLRKILPQSPAGRSGNRLHTYIRTYNPKRHTSSKVGLESGERAG